MKQYGQFCPVAKAAEIFNERWTPLIIRELMCGSHRFNELKRGNPLMSPSILSHRLKSLDESGVIEKRKSSASDSDEYFLTQAGKELGQVVIQLGLWGDKWTRSRLTKDDYDPALLMWDVRRRINAKVFPKGKSVLHFQFMDMPSKKRAWWLVVDNGDVDLCLKNPGFDIDLEIRTTAKVMANIWSGHTSLKAEIRDQTLFISGSRKLKSSMDLWLGYSVFKNPDELLNA